MQLKAVVTGLVSLSVLADAASVERRSPFGRTLGRRQDNARNRGGNQGGNGGGLALNSNLVQTGSQQDGNNPGADGQSASTTVDSDNANFINFCQGKTLTNGQQVRTGSCNGIVMGNIPSVENMVSAVFVNPQDGDTLPSDTTFNIQVQTVNFAPGTFTNATSTYYSAPQDLDGNGNIIGHTHVTVQSTGNSLNPTQPLDPKLFVFFKGINDAGNGQGLLSATVTGGLPAGNYRLCSMSSAANHQPVLMPVAQRGAQDDCVRFTVGDSGNSGNSGNNGSNDSNNGNAGNAGNGNGNAGNTGNNNGNAGNAGNNGNNGNNGNTNNAGNNNGNTGNNGNTNNAGTGTGNTNNAQDGQTSQDGQDGQTGNGQNGQDGQNSGQGSGTNDTPTGSDQTGPANNGTTTDDQNGQNDQTEQGGSTQGSGRRGGKGKKATQSAAAAAASTGVSAAATTAPAVSNNASTGGKGGASHAAALGGIAAPPVSSSGNKDRPFEVQGNTFTTKSAANQRACDVQNNLCANAVNSQRLSGVSVSDCNNQIATCVSDLASS
ncbi:hypothetical protein Trco_004758 [Trichoderma cornu-damae]|uniref:Ribosomal protein s17 n=1 Tax=Trichoderma cornu-damae TaxID=654480 RepID=A0A9P8QHV5_9HYPO|nr:hypothetical protein Trco_004758 [Trichoderma cornu-damae]